MKGNTPPSSPHSGFVDDEEIDLGDIEEVLELDDDTNLDDVADQLAVMEEEEEMEDDDDRVLEDDATLVFSQHTGSVFCCAFSPIGNFVASGGEDDFAYLWEATTGNVICKCTSHKDSVTCLGFSHDGLLLATGDLKGFIQVWRVSSGNMIWEFEMGGDLQWMSWHHGSHVLLAGTAEGDLWMWLVPEGGTRTFPNYGIGTQCGTFLPDGKRAAVGYDDGSLRVFDLKGGSLIMQFSDAMAHSQPVTCIASHLDNNLLVTGSLDATIKLVNLSGVGKVIGSLSCVAPVTEAIDHSEDEIHAVEAVSFCPMLPNIVVSATLAGVVIVWDLVSQVMRHVLVQGCGTSQMKWHPTHPILFTAGLDGCVRSYDVRTGDAVASFTGHRKSILALDVNREGTSLITSSDDGTVRIFSLI